MATTIEELVRVAKSEITEISVADVKLMVGGNTVFIDVREPPEWKDGIVPNALCIPRGVIEWRCLEEDSLKDRTTSVVLYCKTGGRSALAAQSLQQLGFENVMSMAGGFEAWSKNM